MNTDRPDPSRPEDPDHGLDVDAAFADIVARFGPVPQEPAEQQAPAPVEEPTPAPVEEQVEEPAEEAVPEEHSWAEHPEPRLLDADDGHFVPPPPPPLPPVDPRRRTAWVALLGSPVVALLLAMFTSGVPGWVGLLLVTAFVGGFGYLVATMRSSPPDDWSDDGARL